MTAVQNMTLVIIIAVLIAMSLVGHYSMVDDEDIKLRYLKCCDNYFVI